MNAIQVFVSSEDEEYLKAKSGNANAFSASSNPRSGFAFAERSRQAPACEGFAVAKGNVGLPKAIARSGANAPR